MVSKVQSEKENIQRLNCLSLIETGGCYSYYSNIDYLTIKLVENTDIVKTLHWLTENSPNYLIDCGGFKIQYESVLFGGQLTVLRLYDDKGNKLGCIHLKNNVLRSDGMQKQNKNVATNVEFTGDFWKLYGEYFPFFCDFFGIDVEKEKNVTRLDYCIDIAWIDVDEVYKKYRAPFDVWLWKDGQGFYLGNVLTGWTDKSDRHEMAIYNKKLDILKKNKHNIETLIGEKPYMQYIKETFPITRFEYRATSRSLREASASVNYCIQYGRQLACSYASRFYMLDLTVFFEDFKRFDFPVRSDPLISVMLGKKAYMASCMIKAYCSSLRDYKTEAHVFELLYQMYGDRLQNYLEKKHPTREQDEKWNSIYLKQEISQKFKFTPIVKWIYAELEKDKKEKYPI